MALRRCTCSHARDGARRDGCLGPSVVGAGRHMLDKRQRSERNDCGYRFRKPTILGFIDAQRLPSRRRESWVLRNVGATPADVPAGSCALSRRRLLRRLRKLTMLQQRPSWVTKLLHGRSSCWTLKAPSPLPAGGSWLQLQRKRQMPCRRVTGSSPGCGGCSGSTCRWSLRRHRRGRSHAAGDIVLSVAPRALPGIASKAVSEAYVLKVHREAILLGGHFKWPSNRRADLAAAAQSTSSGAPAMRSRCDGLARQPDARSVHVRFGVQRRKIE